MSRTTATHCPYCALQCGIHIEATSNGCTVEPNARFPVNKGGLCIKGWSSTALLDHPERPYGGEPEIADLNRWLVRVLAP